MTASLTLALFAGYFLLVDRALTPESPLKAAYRQFLLETLAEENKIIIVSGSNSSHAINAFMVEEYFKRPTINVADNAGFPLEHKIYNLAKYTRPGDVVIMPLEWGQYVDHARYPRNYVAALLDENSSYSFYFNNLPLTHRVSMVFRSMSVAASYKSAIHLLRGEIGSQDSRETAIGRLNFNLAHGGRLSRGSSPLDSVEEDRRSFFPSCDRYVLGLAVVADFQISDRFKANLKLLKLLTDKQVQIVFAWPTVVAVDDRPCYSLPMSDHLDSFAKDIEKVVAEHGFRFIGDPRANSYETDCFLNTPFHIRSSCADGRTKVLIENLVDYGIAPKPGGYDPGDTDQLLNDRASDILAQIPQD